MVVTAASTATCGWRLATATATATAAFVWHPLRCCSPWHFLFESVTPPADPGQRDSCLKTG